MAQVSPSASLPPLLSADKNAKRRFAWGVYFRDLVDAYERENRVRLTGVYIARNLATPTSPPAISEWLNGSTFPNIAACYDIARFFGVAVDDVMAAAGYDTVVSFEKFYEEVVTTARQQHWPRFGELDFYLRELVNPIWQKSSSDYVTAAHQIINSTLKLQQRAQLVATQVHAYRNDEHRELSIHDHPLPAAS